MIVTDDFYLLQKWGKSEEFYKLEIKTKKLVKCNKSSEVNRKSKGFVHRYLNGKLAIYKNEEGWSLFVDGEFIKFEEIETIKVVRKGLFIASIIVTCLGKKYTFFDNNLSDCISFALDPTYDKFDQHTDIFSYWLKEKFELES